MTDDPRTYWGANLGPLLRLTPHGQLRLDKAGDAYARLEAAFAAGSGTGLLALCAADLGSDLPPALVWWRDFANLYLAAICLLGEAPGAPPPPSDAALATLVLTAPMMPGAEYITTDMLRRHWVDLDAAFAAALVGKDRQAVMTALNPAWNLVGRVHFNLAENRRDPDLPFAFMATYTTSLSAAARAQHVPLGQAMRDYAGPANRARLLALLQPVQRAAESCDWLRAMVEGGEIFHPLRWTAPEAGRLLASAGDLERAGVVLRMPANWRASRPLRPKVAASIGDNRPSRVGLDGLMDFRMEVTLDGDALTTGEIADLLAGTDGLVLLRGHWVEVDRARLAKTMDAFKRAEDLAARDQLTFAEAMRMLAGTALTADAEAATNADWASVTAGPWLAETLHALRAADGDIDPGPALHATLRPYQKSGVRWLHLLAELGLGACLADDMGLGKTIQVLSLLLVRQKGPNLLVAPASLLANWQAEIARFAPGLKARTVHPSVMPAEELRGLTQADFDDFDLIITSYGGLLRIPALAKAAWRLVVLDEAQAIKNAGSKQTRAAKALRAEARIALTGTPVENHLGDLWSIFDFINPGLLGTAKQFAGHVKALAKRAHNPYGPMRALVGPYILRRMKTDRAVIADLPDKTEMVAHCHLSRKQAALYERTVADLADALADAGGMARRGVVLATLMRLKQICNHPSHWLGDDGWAEADSGKLTRLREIAEVVAARQEKMLVFTQFKEMTAPLSRLLAGIFGRPGLVLHGAVAVKDRRALVDAFQSDDGPPFFVLSLKAGGAGLNLTAASHVVHFDRWWNPAVENQATDRAFRIGQKRNVVVHKFSCLGTIEEKIAKMIADKQMLSDEVLAGGGEISLTELNDSALLQLVALDINAALKD